MPDRGTWILKRFSASKNIFVTGIKKSMIRTDIVTLRDEILKRIKEKKNFRIAATQQGWKIWVIITLQGVTITDGWEGEYGGFYQYQKD